MAKRPTVRMLIGGAVLLLVGCGEDKGPLGPELATEVLDVQAALDCKVDVQAGSLECVPHAPEISGGASGAIIGGQGENIYLEATNVTVSGDNFTADVTVKNLLTQTLGTADGQTPHANGVRVFFTYQGDGAAAIPDGIGMFNRSEQPYFQYDQMIAPGQTSLPKTWTWSLEPGTTEFDFRVYVAGRVPDEEQLVGEMYADVKTVAVGHSHSCGITSSGKAFCWGNNTNGRLGNKGSGASPYAPTVVIDSFNAQIEFLSISAGAAHNCGVSKDYKLYCWGHGGNGKLGNGAAANYGSAILVADTLDFRAVSAGNNHSCGIGTDGTAYCWGHGGLGQIGDGTSTHQSSPVAVSSAKKFSVIAAGTGHSCGITTDSTAYCWGSSDDGRLGAGDLGNYNSPNPVDISLLPAGTKFVSISVGYRNTCALTADGTAYCWGTNHAGVLGIGALGILTPSLNRPEIPVAGGHKFHEIVVGSFEQNSSLHVCGLTFDGTAYCWGANDAGQLGTGDTENRIVPAAVNTDKKFIDIDVGYQHTCGTTADGKMYCWGANGFRELGIGEAGQIVPTTPVQTVTNFVWLEGGARRGGEPVYAPAWKSFEAYAYVLRGARAISG